MNPQTQVALIGLCGVVFGAIVSIGPTIWITKKQLAVGYEKTKLEVLQKKIEKLEALMAKLSTVRMEVGTGQISPQEMIGKAMLAFTEKAGIARQCYHYLTRELSSEIDELQSSIGGLVYADKTGQTLDVNTVKELFERVKLAESNLRDEILNRLRVWQAEVEYLVSRRDT